MLLFQSLYLLLLCQDMPDARCVAQSHPRIQQYICIHQTEGAAPEDNRPVSVTDAEVVMH